MRALAVIVILGAGVALADEKSESARYASESTRICRERLSSPASIEVCPLAHSSGLLLYAIESRGVFPGAQFTLDSRDPEEIKEIASRCRELTLDGGLIDGLTALDCVAETVRLRNWEARRALRTEPEGGGDE